MNGQKRDASWTGAQFAKGGLVKRLLICFDENNLCLWYRPSQLCSGETLNLGTEQRRKDREITSAKLVNLGSIRETGFQRKFQPY